jgi:GrpB-like predicted nucleotidyltransferase (UPF0157 family)
MAGDAGARGGAGHADPAIRPRGRAERAQAARAAAGRAQGTGRPRDAVDVARVRVQRALEAAGASAGKVVAYDQGWPERFGAWRGRLAELLGPVALRIEHVGSTSVPGLAAKPVVDIQVSVADLSDEDRYVPPCEAAGLQFRLRDDEHRYFQPPPGQPREVHVHVCQQGAEWERVHLLFRDYLRCSADAREAYAAAKREAARLWGSDRPAYTEAKTDVILGILDQAEAWATATGWGIVG